MANTGKYLHALKRFYIYKQTSQAYGWIICEYIQQYLRLSALKYTQMKVCLRLPYVGNTWRQEARTSIG